MRRASPDAKPEDRILDQSMCVGWAVDMPARTRKRAPRANSAAAIRDACASHRVKLPSERQPINDPVGVTAIAFWPVVVRATFENVGDRAAEQALVRFLMPETVGLVRSGPAREDRTR